MTPVNRVLLFDMVHRTPFFLPWLYPTLTWRIPHATKELFLTFDDGPVPGPTEFVIDTLAAAGIRATFFCIGDNVQKYPAIYRSLIAHGHTVGNHTFHHVNGWRTSTRNYVNEVRLCEDALGEREPAAGAPLFRPPYGRISRNQIGALTAYRIIMWDVLTLDYRRTLSPERCLRNTISAVRDGSIVVFHDSLKAEKNLRYVLPEFIAHFQSEGYNFNVIPT